MIGFIECCGLDWGKLVVVTSFYLITLEKPANSFHFDIVVSCLVLIVSKYSSCLTWNCGDILPVVRFRSNETVLVCLGELPRYRPRVHLVSHFGIDCPSWSLASKE